MTEKLCKAEIHHPDFYSKNGEVIPHSATSRDHFTPKCICKIFGFKPEEQGSKENLIPMNDLCHKLKDRSTRNRQQLLSWMMEGNSLSLNDYRRMRNRNDRVYIHQTGD